MSHIHTKPRSVKCEKMDFVEMWKTVMVCGYITTEI
jgi:hypothetical protein